MFTRIDDILAGAGIISFLVGLYLWLGLAAALMVLGVGLVYAGVRIEPNPVRRDTNEFDQTTHTDRA